MRGRLCPVLQVRVLQQGPGGGDQHTIRIVLEGKGIAEGSTVELHW